MIAIELKVKQNFLQIIDYVQVLPNIVYSFLNDIGAATSFKLERFQFLRNFANHINKK